MKTNFLARTIIERKKARNWIPILFLVFTGSIAKATGTKCAEAMTVNNDHVTGSINLRVQATINQFSIED